MSDIFLRRRSLLLKRLPANSVVVVPSAMLAIRSGDVTYPFRQDSRFAYLTNFKEPSAIAVLVSSGTEHKYILFCMPRDLEQEMWNGVRVGCERAVKDYHADEAYPIQDFELVFPKLIRHCDTVYWLENPSRTPFWLPHLKRLCAVTEQAYTFRPAAAFIDEMRIRKSKEEIRLIKKAVEITEQGHRRAMLVCQPQDNERDIEAALLATFCAAGTVPAYPSIVGGGSNACILHYLQNDMVLKDGDLLLVDAGAEYQGYAADVTRTYPVNGCFSAAQKELYEIVLEAQTAALKKVKPGNAYNEFHQAAVAVLTRGLVSVGLLKGKVQSLIKRQAYRQFYMHNTGHWLGLDVHDVGTYYVNGDWRNLESGMVVTVEPGLYIRPAQDIDRRWWNIGIRIEDDVLVNAKGNEVLSADLPKTVKGIESCMNGHDATI